MTECIFCNIASGDIETDFIYEDDLVVAFKDLDPKAPFHFLIIPKKHISTLNEITPEDTGAVGKIFLAAKTIAEEQGFDKSGYRLVANCEKDAGQEVFHIHVHLLAGRKMQWPPG